MFTMLPELLSVLQRTNDYVSLEEICKKLPESESYEEMSNLRELLSSASEAVQLGARFGLIHYGRWQKYKIAVNHAHPESHSFYSRLRILNEDIATNGLKNALVKARASEDGSSDSDESEDREELKASSGRKKRTMTPKVSSSANKKSDKSPSTPKRKRK
ncbi:uncharacterized protein LOC118460529 isoform X1 [Anopheles albimanus]|uniref:uncharacterized protein LOC118460529 isoform X1 n=1 Tax=Anopheles albimanus TaxID=7167 RepID=UPI001641C262|nr:uncharacterized protein LOC118460529 isoform X1 [Anopheles albimanus]